MVKILSLTEHLIVLQLIFEDQLRTPSLLTDCGPGGRSDWDLVDLDGADRLWLNAVSWLIAILNHEFAVKIKQQFSVIPGSI